MHEIRGGKNLQLHRISAAGDRQFDQLLSQTQRTVMIHTNLGNYKRGVPGTNFAIVYLHG